MKRHFEWELAAEVKITVTEKAFLWISQILLPSNHADDARILNPKDTKCQSGKPTWCSRGVQPAIYKYIIDGVI